MSILDPVPAARRGVLLFAHGARDPRWADPFHAVARAVQARDPEVAVELAFLEFMSPDLATGAQRLVDAGCGVVDIVPLFLGAGGHVRRDLPLLVERLNAGHPGVRWRLHAAVGEQPRVIEAMATWAVEVAQAEPVGQSAGVARPSAS
jgi:sirohydrochlorin cobaltochelatase